VQRKCHGASITTKKLNIYNHPTHTLDLHLVLYSFFFYGELETITLFSFLRFWIKVIVHVVVDCIVFFRKLTENRKFLKVVQNRGNAKQ